MLQTSRDTSVFKQGRCALKTVSSVFVYSCGQYARSACKWPSSAPRHDTLVHINCNKADSIIAGQTYRGSRSLTRCACYRLPLLRLRTSKLRRLKGGQRAVIQTNRDGERQTLVRFRKSIRDCIVVGRMNDARSRRRG